MVRPAVSRHRWFVPQFASHELVLVVWQGLLRSRWELRVDGEVVWTGRHGWLAVLVELLAALAGLAPPSHDHLIELDGCRGRCEVWPSLGLARLTADITPVA